MKSAILSAAVLVSSVISSSSQFLEMTPAHHKSACLTECCQTLTSRPAQTYTYYQNTGHFIGGSGEWHVNTYGYSGQGSGYMNPKEQCVSNTGPLPADKYKLSYCKNTMHDPPVTRPCAFYLEP